MEGLRLTGAGLCSDDYIRVYKIWHLGSVMTTIAHAVQS